MVNGQILIVWMWGTMKEKQKSQVFYLRTWKNGVVIHEDSKDYEGNILGGEGIRSSVLGMLSLLCLVEIQVEMLNKEMYR